MVTLVTGAAFDPASYLNQIKGLAAGTTGSNSNTDGDNTTGTASPSDSVTLSQQLVSLLQQTGSGSANGDSLSTLLGQGGNGVSSSNPLAGVYNTLLYNLSTTQPVATALQTQEQQQANATAQANPLQNILSSYNSGINAYNQTLLQNAQAAVTANNGQLPLVT